MEELFPQMMSSLSNAVSGIETEMAKVFTSDRKSLTDEQWTEYGDSLESLQYRLRQLNTVLHFEYEFGEDMAKDIINYSRLLNESRSSCEELAGYLLTRDHDAWSRDETFF